MLPLGKFDSYKRGLLVCRTTCLRSLVHFHVMNHYLISGHDLFDTQSLLVTIIICNIRYNFILVDKERNCMKKKFNDVIN